MQICLTGSNDVWPRRKLSKPSWMQICLTGSNQFSSFGSMGSDAHCRIRWAGWLYGAWEILFYVRALWSFAWWQLYGPVPDDIGKTITLQFGANTWCQLWASPVCLNLSVQDRAHTAFLSALFYNILSLIPCPSNLLSSQSSDTTSLRPAHDANLSLCNSVAQKGWVLLIPSQ